MASNFTFLNCGPFSNSGLKRSCYPDARRKQQCFTKASLETSQILTFGAIPVALGAAVYTGIRIYSYAELEVITARMLTTWVPHGGARVIQIGGGTRQLFYYPKDTVQVTVVGPYLNEDLIQQGGMQAAVPAIAKKLDYQDLSFSEDGTTDAVVIVNVLPQTKDMNKLLSEAARVLKKECPLILIQRTKGLVPQIGQSVAQQQEIIDLIDKQLQFGEFKYDIALQKFDPHVIGVTFKQINKTTLLKAKGFQ
eukprot:TRINITY_DN54676_c0_g1_i1.p1 TRINITY_DN54676_c0_g1~~TRINITY_DN54676_c0_g1_i1.p1  ORF type:complete len:251 (+),score=16.06 TRINITY_DN54676_c0_g1_i1:123-875(+)